MLINGSQTKLQIPWYVSLPSYSTLSLCLYRLTFLIQFFMHFSKHIASAKFHLGLPTLQLVSFWCFYLLSQVKDQRGAMTVLHMVTLFLVIVRTEWEFSSSSIMAIESRLALSWALLISSLVVCANSFGAISSHCLLDVVSATGWLLHSPIFFCDSNDRYHRFWVNIQATNRNCWWRFLDANFVLYSVFTRCTWMLKQDGDEC